MFSHKFTNLSQDLCLSICIQFCKLANARKKQSDGNYKLNKEEINTNQISCSDITLRLP